MYGRAAARRWAAVEAWLQTAGSVKGLMTHGQGAAQYPAEGRARRVPGT
jgi:hypothetical protein